MFLFHPKKSHFHPKRLLHTQVTNFPSSCIGDKSCDVQRRASCAIIERASPQRTDQKKHRQRWLLPFFQCKVFFAQCFWFLSSILYIDSTWYFFRLFSMRCKSSSRLRFEGNPLTETVGGSGLGVSLGKDHHGWR